jgi:hypothetical protein
VLIDEDIELQENICSMLLEIEQQIKKKTKLF